MLEYAARDKRTDIILSVTPYFLEEWQNMRERLRPLAEDSAANPKQEKTEADLQIIREYFPVLEQSMKNLDIDTADEIMQHFEKFQYPKEVSPLMEELSLSVTNLDAEQSAQIIRKLEKLF